MKPYQAHSSTQTSSDQFIKNIVVTGDVIFTSDPGFLDVTSTTDPTAYDLKSTATDVIDKGADVAEITSDFRDRPRPAGASFDLGAFEFQPSAGGASTAPMNTTTPSTGSQPSTTKASSGGAGGQPSTSKASTPSAGSQPSTSKASTPGAGGQSPASNGNSDGNGGQSPASSANSDGDGGQSESTKKSGTSVDGNQTTAPSGTSAAAGELGGCACSVPGTESRGSFALLAMTAAFLLGGGARRRRTR